MTTPQISVATIVDWVNQQNLTSVAPRTVRQGMNAVCEQVLLEASIPLSFRLLYAGVDDLPEGVVDGHHDNTRRKYIIR